VIDNNGAFDPRRKLRGSTRTGPVAEPMRAAAANLTDADILALSAYLVSLKPR